MTRAYRSKVAVIGLGATGSGMATGFDPRAPTPIASQASQMFLTTAGKGLGAEDTSVARLHADLTDLALPSTHP